MPQLLRRPVCSWPPFLSVQLGGMYTTYVLSVPNKLQLALLIKVFLFGTIICLISTTEAFGLTECMVFSKLDSSENPRVQRGHLLVSWTFRRACLKNGCEPFSVERSLGGVEAKGGGEGRGRGGGGGGGGEGKDNFSPLLKRCGRQTSFTGLGYIHYLRL